MNSPTECIHHSYDNRNSVLVPNAFLFAISVALELQNREEGQENNDQTKGLANDSPQNFAKSLNVHILPKNVLRQRCTEIRMRPPAVNFSLLQSLEFLWAATWKTLDEKSLQARIAVRPFQNLLAFHRFESDIGKHN